MDSLLLGRLLRNTARVPTTRRCTPRCTGALERCSRRRCRWRKRRSLLLFLLVEDKQTHQSFFFSCLALEWDWTKAGLSPRGGVVVSKECTEPPSVMQANLYASLDRLVNSIAIVCFKIAPSPDQLMVCVFALQTNKAQLRYTPDCFSWTDGHLNPAAGSTHTPLPPSTTCTAVFPRPSLLTDGSSTVHLGTASS